MSILNVEKFQSKSEDKNYLKNLEKIKKDPKYIENQKQIEIISKVLVKHADIPEEVIESLINAVTENVTMECNC